jgi:hypothetical protein
MMAAAAQLSATTSSGDAERELNPNEYFVDALFRSESARPDSNGASVCGEAERIFANALRQGYVPPVDKSYLAQLVASKTGLNKTDAEKRVSDVFAEAQLAADIARKTIAHSLLWTFLAPLDWRVLRELRRDHRGQATRSVRPLAVIRESRT